MSGTHQHLDLERLARVIAMGGSEHDGEALAAMRQADRLISEAGMTWHEVLLPGRLVEALTAEAQQLRDELTTLRAAKAAETKQLHDALAAVRRRRRRTHQRWPVGIIILCCLAAMYIISDVISSCAGGAVLVANSPPNVSGIAPPASVAPFPSLKGPGRAHRLSQAIGTGRRDPKDPTNGRVDQCSTDGTELRLKSRPG